MAKLKGLKELAESMEKLQAAAENVRQNLDEKREWLEGRSEKYQESDAAQEWDEHLSEVENILDEIDNLQIPETE